MMSACPKCNTPISLFKRLFLTRYEFTCPSCSSRLKLSKSSKLKRFFIFFLGLFLWFLMYSIKVPIMTVYSLQAAISGLILVLLISAGQLFVQTFELIE